MKQPPADDEPLAVVFDSLDSPKLLVFVDAPCSIPSKVVADIIDSSEANRFGAGRRRSSLMKKLILLIIYITTSIACGQLLTSAQPAEQISIEHAEISYYDITGSTADELRDSMNQLRPRDRWDGNLPVDSYTDWYIAWTWPGYGTENCDLSTAVVTYRINVIMPRWQAPGDASPELIAKWEKYLQSLARHEKGHVENIVNNYSNVKTVIQAATCSTANTEAQKVLEQLRRFDSDYDSETNHGESQGAIFP
jgi:predicted secreted Zn-dependent protease